MITARIDGKKASKVLNNIVAYTNGYVKESKAKQPYIANKMADLSIEGFYQYLDNLARVHPGMLHHVYEWGQVGNPDARLFKLKKVMSGGNARVLADFLKSESTQGDSNTPFYDKANVMEDGVTVIINEVDAQALFFEIDGEEFFRLGPIVVANPGGPEVRGSFKKAFEEFYNVYFDDVYLRSIKFYQQLESLTEYYNNFGSAAMSSNASGMGRKTALSWVMHLPGDDYEQSSN